MVRVYNGVLFGIVVSLFSILYYLIGVEVIVCNVNGLMVFFTMSKIRRKIMFCCNERYFIFLGCVFIIWYIFILL